MQSADSKYYKIDVEDSKFWIIICQTELNKSTKEISETTNPSSFMEHKMLHKEEEILYVKLD